MRRGHLTSIPRFRLSDPGTYTWVFTGVRTDKTFFDSLVVLVRCPEITMSGSSDTQKKEIIVLGAGTCDLKLIKDHTESKPVQTNN